MVPIGSGSPEHHFGAVSSAHERILHRSICPRVFVLLQRNSGIGWLSILSHFSEDQALTSVGCWTHCRRKFVNAIKAAQKDLPEKALKNSIAYQALARISVIYKLDESWKERTSEYRLEHRQRILKPLVDEYFGWVKEQVKTCSVLPKSETGEGLSYSINQEKYLRAFLEKRTACSRWMILCRGHRSCR